MTATVSRDPDPAARTMRGRRREWTAVLGLLRAAESGRPGTLLVEGEPGTGKSLLMDQAVREAASRGLITVAGRAREFGSPAPAEPLLAAFGERSPPEPWIERLRSALDRRARVGPVLVALDDLQWADPDTFAALEPLASRRTRHAVAWLLVRCTGAGPDAAARLFDRRERDGAERRRLGPIGDDAATEIAIDLLGAVPDAALLASAAEAGGNPFLITELLTGLRDEGAIRVSGGRARLSSARLPDRVRTGVARRVGGLSPRTRHLLTVSAVLGRSFCPEDVAEILGTTPAALVPGLEELLEAGLLAAAPAVLRFRHELIRRVVVETVPPPVRQALHRQIGELLAGREDSVASAAAHLIRGVRPGDARALARLDEVIAFVLPRSPRNAATLAMHALELTGPAEPARPERTLTAVRALTATDRLDEAARLARAAFDRPMPAPACARLHCVLAEILSLRGRDDEAAEEASAALAEPGLPGGLRDDAELALLNANAGSGTRERAQAIVSSKGEHGDALVAGAFITLALTEWDAGRLTSGLALAEEAVRRAVAADTRRVHPRLVLAMLLTDAQRHDTARTVMTSAGDDTLGPLAWSAAPAVLAARAHLAAGRFHEAIAAAETCLSSAGGPRLLVASARSVLVTASLRAGNVGAAHEHTAAHRTARAAPGYPHTALALAAAQVTEAREGAERLAGDFGALCEQVLRHRWTLVADPAAAAWLVRTAPAVDARPAAEAVVTAVERLAADNPAFPAIRAAADHARGLLDGSPAALGRAAADHLDPWARASATEDLAVLVAADEETAEARRRAVAAFDTALSAYETMEAVRDAARVRRRLRRLGVRRRHWSSTDRPVSGWASLTDTERAVSELVAQGLTNRQVADQLFMSAHTVAFHLRHVFRKLNIGSRVELARLTLQRSA
ncbi:AAA family ATPase [Actinoallomurus sp. CA-142502]|uniref:helix-turn-helix transcriptional regulator n=1 Tax=Actinoallomurus sp. CA-142502 TaxID=3239885 RepID=UPI003D8CCD0C